MGQQKDYIDLKNQNQSLFTPFAFVPYHDDVDDFQKPFHEEKEMQKVKITFDQSPSNTTQLHASKYTTHVSPNNYMDNWIPGEAHSPLVKL